MSDAAPHKLEYLKRGNRDDISCEDYEFRVIRFSKSKNPIEASNDIPPSLPTEVSCNSLMLVIASDLKIIKPKVAEQKKYFRIRRNRELESFSFCKELDQGSDLDGVHNIGLQLYHCPDEMDYSHIQFDLIHTHIDIEENVRITRLKRDNWRTNTLRQKGDVKQFFKNYRNEMIVSIMQKFVLVDNDSGLLYRPSSEFKRFYLTPMVRNNWIFRTLNFLGVIK